MIYTFHANPVRYVIDLWAPPGDGTQPTIIKLQIQLRWDPLEFQSFLTETKDLKYRDGTGMVLFNYNWIIITYKYVIMICYNNI